MRHEFPFIWTGGEGDTSGASSLPGNFSATPFLPGNERSKGWTRERERVRERGGRTTFFWYRSDANCFPKHGNMGPSPVNVTLTLPVTWLLYLSTPATSSSSPTGMGAIMQKMRADAESPCLNPDPCAFFYLFTGSHCCSFLGSLQSRPPSPQLQPGALAGCNRLLTCMCHLPSWSGQAYSSLFLQALRRVCNSGRCSSEPQTVCHATMFGTVWHSLWQPTTLRVFFQVLIIMVSWDRWWLLWPLRSHFSHAC